MKQGQATRMGTIECWYPVSVDFLYMSFFVCADMTYANPVLGVAYAWTLFPCYVN